MEKRLNKRNQDSISLLGFGMMRLPRIDPDKQDIDYATGQKMVDYAIAHGVNYFDTAYVYHAQKSETFTGHALSKYPRESFKVATKMPSWELSSSKDAPRLFEEQLKRLQVEYIDYYLCHALGSVEEFKRRYLDTGALKYLHEEKKKGRIRNLGFSFHGSVDALEELLKVEGWEFVQIQLNYLDWDIQNAKRQYEILEEHGLPCIVMEPVRGGNLVTLSDEAAAVLKAPAPDDSIASWAIRFAASLPNVMTVLSGMTTMDHVVDNVKTMTDFSPLEDAGLATLQKAVAIYRDAGTIPCTGCRYCMDCPSGVDIPAVFEIYNKCATARRLPSSFGDAATAKENAAFFAAAYKALPPEARADRCTDCKACVSHCPQSIKIPGRMREIAGLAVAAGI
jgi:predicted aldo/keto reductase-like oxidoreductase